MVVNIPLFANIRKQSDEIGKLSSPQDLWQDCHGGYLKLWIPESDNARKLEELRELIRRPALLREIFDREFPQSAFL